MPNRNVLVYPGGTEIGLEIGRSLKTCKHVETFSAGQKDTAAECIFAKHYKVQPVTSRNWITELKNVIENNEITHLFPAHDDVFVPVLEAQDEFNVKIVTSSLASCRIARSKAKTIEQLNSIIPTPALYKNKELVNVFPVFVKPDKGQGSKGALKISNYQHLIHELKKNPSLIIQEYLPGDEYTVDCFSDREKGLLYCKGRNRLRTINGIASRSFFIDDIRFADYANRIQGKIPFQGAWFFQLKESVDGELKLLEVAPRIAGTSGLSRVTGVNLPLLSLYESDRAAIEIPSNIPGVLVQRILKSAYFHQIDFEALYLDFDDTLVLDGKVNTQLVKLVYQTLNEKKPIVLVTRHEGNLNETLSKFRLQGLFDKVVHLKKGESKRSAIHHKSCFFIDDSYREHVDLRHCPGVYPLHPSSVELLINHHEL
jgi:carbamoyl-phosphate synthase large subunit